MSEPVIVGIGMQGCAAAGNPSRLCRGYRLTPQEFAALVARSQALDTRYANHSAPTAHVRSTEQPGSTGSTIDWSYIGIAALAAMLLAAAAATVTRRRHQLGF